jgi:formylglycine-generating enzyme required for sulfatase activity
MIACGNPAASDPVAVTGVSLDQPTLTLPPNSTATLAATVSPDNAANKAVSWASDDTDVATVSEAGVVTAVAAGTADITVTTADGGFTATCAVKVTNYGISLDPTGTHTFPAAVVGYAAQTVQTVTVSNTGNQATGELTAALSGGDSSSFTLTKTSIPSISVGGNDTFPVVPKTGLAAGTYADTVTVSGGNDISAAFTVSFTVLPGYTMINVNSGTVSVSVDYNGSTSGYGTGPFSNAETVNVLIDTFSIGETEVTYELWRAVYDWATHTDRGANAYSFATSGRQGGDTATGPVGTNQHPVTTISWRDAVVWCNAYSEALGKTPVYYLEGTADFSNTTRVLRESESSDISAGSGKAERAVLNSSATGFRLPTDAEWEYAARGGDPSDTTNWNYTYAGSGTVGDVAVYPGNSGNKTAVVKSKVPNGLGLYDMSGNVWERCQDVYSDANRVVRGGSWRNDASYCTVARRNYDAPHDRFNNIGFRVVCP